MKDEVIIAYLKNDLPEADRTKVEDWIRASDENEREFNRVSFLWENSAASYREVSIDKGRAWERIRSAIDRERISSGGSIQGTFRSVSRIAAAAAILIGLGISGTLLYRHIRPAEIARVEAVTTGMKTDVSLPDHSRVWLNRNSELSYPERFRDGTREVRLQGEAYFEVEKNRRKPFIVHSGGLAIRVTGTSFNVRCDTTPHKSGGQTGITVTVLTGSVVLSNPANPGYELTLEPGYQGVYDPANRSLTKKITDDDNVLAWKTGILKFENTSIGDVCAILSRHFNIDIEPGRSDSLMQKRLTATYDNKDLDEILDILALTLEISYTRNENHIRLYTGPVPEPSTSKQLP